MDNETGKILAVHNIDATVTFPNYKYKDSETALAIGDCVIVEGSFVSVDGAVEYINLNDEGKIEFVKKVTPNYHEGEEGSAALVINSDAELDALIKSGNYYGKILKLLLQVIIHFIFLVLVQVILQFVILRLVIIMVMAIAIIKFIIMVKQLLQNQM